ncbi:hypothetical protein TWF569_007849 [Orbilia oligospora]|nr:hypothetical protein TWF569_007849 [Orbilia oligospora]
MYPNEWVSTWVARDSKQGDPEARRGSKCLSVKFGCGNPIVRVMTGCLADGSNLQASASKLKIMTGGPMALDSVETSSGVPRGFVFKYFWSTSLACG